MKLENTVTEVEKVNRVAKVIKEYLGEGVELKQNKARDIILMSKDKKIRFDINNPGGDKPHFHIEKYENGRWIDATDEHRIYFKEE